MPGERWMTSPKTTIPRSIPATGSAAVMAGSDACSGAALKALSISQKPARLATARA
jgi:hypothetical protein